jgi:hypothetical protein
MPSEVDPMLSPVDPNRFELELTGATAAPMMPASAEPPALSTFEVCAFWLTTTATIARPMMLAKIVTIPGPIELIFYASVRLLLCLFVRIFSLFAYANV